MKAKLLLPTLLLIPALCACSNSDTADGAPASTLALASASTTGTTHRATTSTSGYVGKWTMQGVPSSSDQTVVTRMKGQQLQLMLPQSMAEPVGRQLLLNRTARDTFAATRDGITVQFTLISAGHAGLSIKGHNAKGNVDLEMPLVTANDATAD
ncbi:MAG TPA: hypothetical protein VJ862_02075 [Rhodanobacteraceae bacterium]|nr:hypothetical protein [Rhodanobacteraceae bacterium]